MKFDIVPISRTYSGMDRSLNPENFLTPETKPYYKILLDIYFSYLDLMCSPFEGCIYDEELFCTVEHFYREFRSYNVPCEVIVFDTEPINSVYGFSFEFLGIDIVKDMAESLIGSDNPENIPVGKLNRNGLFGSIADVDNAIRLFNVQNTRWEPCWIYKVKL